jgi:predicted RNase H-related nuclease YkuK (DUF458 family)
MDKLISIIKNVLSFNGNCSLTNLSYCSTDGMFVPKYSCKIFGSVERERDYEVKKSKPRMRLMNEVYKVSELYLKLADVLVDRAVEVHLDINPNEVNGSSCVINEAIGYIKGTCNVIPLVKPQAFAASYAADRLKGLKAA